MFNGSDRLQLLPTYYSHLQPVHLSVNKSPKDSLDIVSRNGMLAKFYIAHLGNHKPNDFRLNILKPLSVWDGLWIHLHMVVPTLKLAFYILINSRKKLFYRMHNLKVLYKSFR